MDRTPDPERNLNGELYAMRDHALREPRPGVEVRGGAPPQVKAEANEYGLVAAAWLFKDLV